MNRSRAVLEAKHTGEMRKDEEVIFTLRIVNALYDLLGHDLLHFFTLPSGIGHVLHPNWHRLYGELNLRTYFCTDLRTIIG